MQRQPAASGSLASEQWKEKPDAHPITLGWVVMEGWVGQSAPATAPSVATSEPATVPISRPSACSRVFARACVCPGAPRTHAWPHSAARPLGKWRSARHRATPLQRAALPRRSEGAQIRESGGALLMMRCPIHCGLARHSY